MYSWGLTFKWTWRDWCKLLVNVYLPGSLGHCVVRAILRHRWLVAKEALRGKGLVLHNIIMQNKGLFRAYFDIVVADIQGLRPSSCMLQVLPLCLKKPLRPALRPRSPHDTVLKQSTTAVSAVNYATAVSVSADFKIWDLSKVSLLTYNPSLHHNLRVYTL